MDNVSRNVLTAAYGNVQHAMATLEARLITRPDDHESVTAAAKSVLAEVATFWRYKPGPFTSDHDNRTYVTAQCIVAQSR